ncbi:MAG: Rv1355c family protein [Myxococcota bacterium]
MSDVGSLGLAAVARESGVWQPVVVDRTTLDEAGWSAFLEAHPVWRVRDTLHAQLVDLVRTRNPRKVDLTEAECTVHIAALLGSTPESHYGRWVYYPWSGELVHVLGPEEFRELRSDRNRFKTTPAEQEALARQTVGVVGLSVGNVIALTTAQERVAGHIKLADFDHLELSNLNRIRAGVQHLGLPKAVVAARQILELDPYVSLSVFQEGLTDANLDTFLTGAPAVDVVVDECDGIRMKFRLRERARALRIPVLMETSDRGMLDVERFDEEPERPVFHGLVGDVPASALVDIDSERKAILMMKIIGASTTSATAAASLMEIDRTTSAWPQLASDVTLGGATVPMALRRLALGRPLPSGRTYIDLDRHLEERVPPAPLPGARRPSPLPAPGLAAEPHSLAGVPELWKQLVTCATLAPSGGNCQPWAFRYDGDAMWVLHDAVRSKNLLDGRRHASLLAIGAALENLQIAAENESLTTRVEELPFPTDPSVVARVTLKPGIAPGPHVRRQLTAIHQRVTNRKHGVQAPVSGAELLGLMEAARSRNALLEVCVSPRARDEVGAILGCGDRIRFLCGPLHRELMGEVRWPPATKTSDGIGLDQLELSEFQAAAMEVLSRTDVAETARAPGRGRALEEGSRDAVANSSAMALLSFDGDSPSSWLRVGAAVQRVWLAATSARLAMHPMTALLYMFEVATDRPEVFTSAEHEELRSLKRRLQTVFPASRGRTPAFLFRLAHAPDVTARSGRLPLQNVLALGTPEPTPPVH